MTHVGVKGFPAGYNKEYGPEDAETAPTIVDKEIDAIGWVNGGKYFRFANNPDDAEEGNGAEPQKHDGAEHFSNPGGAVFLEAKEEN